EAGQLEQPLGVGLGPESTKPFLVDAGWPAETAQDTRQVAWRQRCQRRGQSPQTGRSGRARPAPPPSTDEQAFGSYVPQDAQLPRRAEEAVTPPVRLFAGGNPVGPGDGVTVVGRVT